MSDRTTRAGLLIGIPRVANELRSTLVGKLDYHSPIVAAAAVEAFAHEVALDAVVRAKNAGKKSVTGDHVAEAIVNNEELNGLISSTIAVTSNKARSKRAKKEAAPKPKKEKKKAAKGAKRPKQRGLKSYTKRVFASLRGDTTITKRADALLAQATAEVFQNLIKSATLFYTASKRKTMRHKDISAAVEMVYPPELAQAARSLANSAMNKLRKEQEAKEAKD